MRIQKSVVMLIEMLKERLVKESKTNLLKLIIYGSYARRESTKDSDIDIFILLKTLNRNIEKRIDEAIYEVMWDNNFKYLLSPYIIDKHRYILLKRRVCSFIDNVEEDGIILWRNPKMK